MDEFRRFFLRGLAALVPTLLTFAILLWVYELVNTHVGTHITRGLQWVCASLRNEPAPEFVNPQRDALLYGTPINEWNEFGQRLTLEYKVIHHRALTLPDTQIQRRAVAAKNAALWEIAFRKYRLHVLGFVIAIILVYFTGFFLASFIGHTSWRLAEGLVGRIPVIRAVYSNVKQVTDFLLSEKKVDFAGVVAVQYPRTGVWSVGLRTGAPLRRVQQESAQELVTVFIPTSPTPFTGYVVQFPRREVVELPMTIDEALRFIVSGGVIKPDMITTEPAVVTAKVNS